VGGESVGSFRAEGDQTTVPQDKTDTPDASPAPALAASGLLDGVSLTIAPGEIHALIGPAGAGKSAVMETVLSGRAPKGASLEIFGRRRARERIGGMLQSAAHDPDRTVAATVRAVSRLYRRPLEIAAALDAVGLSDAAAARVGALSACARRQLDFALALVGNPSLMILDEPFAGLDPEVRRRLRELVRALGDHGRAVLVATQDVNGIETLADRVTVVAGGRMRASGTPEALLDRLGDSAVIAFTLPSADLPDHFPQGLRPVTEVREGRARLTVRNPTPALADLANWAFREQVPLARLTVERPRFEEAYRSIVEAAETEGGAP